MLKKVLVLRFIFVDLDVFFVGFEFVFYSLRVYCFINWVKEVIEKVENVIF